MRNRWSVLAAGRVGRAGGAGVVLGCRVIVGCPPFGSQQTQAWPWSSLGGTAGSDGMKVQVAAWPVSRRPGWEQQVHELVDARTLERVHLSIARGRPLGDDSWTARVARRHGLESTLRDPWRPRKAATKEE